VNCYESASILKREKKEQEKMLVEFYSRAKDNALNHKKPSRSLEV